MWENGYNHIALCTHCLPMILISNWVASQVCSVTCKKGYSYLALCTHCLPRILVSHSLRVFLYQGVGNAITALCFNVHDKSYIQKFSFQHLFGKRYRNIAFCTYHLPGSAMYEKSTVSDITLGTNFMLTNNYMQSVFLLCRILAARPGLIVSVVPFRLSYFPLTHQVPIVKSVPVVHLQELFLFGTSVATRVPGEGDWTRTFLQFCLRLCCVTSFKTDEVQWSLNYLTLGERKSVFLCWNMLHSVSAVVCLFFISIE